MGLNGGVEVALNDGAGTALDANVETGPAVGAEGRRGLDDEEATRWG